MVDGDQVKSESHGLQVWLKGVLLFLWLFSYELVFEGMSCQHLTTGIICRKKKSRFLTILQHCRTYTLIQNTLPYVRELVFKKTPSLCDTLSYIPYVQIWGINHCNFLNLYIDHWLMHCCLFSAYKRGIAKVPSMRNITQPTSKKDDWLLHLSHPKLYGLLCLY